MTSKELVEGFDNGIKAIGIKKIPSRSDIDYRSADYILKSYSEDVIKKELNNYIRAKFVDNRDKKVLILKRYQYSDTFITSVEKCFKANVASDKQTLKYASVEITKDNWREIRDAHLTTAERAALDRQGYIGHVGNTYDFRGYKWTDQDTKYRDS